MNHVQAYLHPQTVGKRRVERFVVLMRLSLLALFAGLDKLIDVGIKTLPTESISYFGIGGVSSAVTGFVV